MLHALIEEGHESSSATGPQRRITCAFYGSISDTLESVQNYETYQIRSLEG